MYSALNKLSEYIKIYLSNTLLCTLLLLIFEIAESLQCILNHGYFLGLTLLVYSFPINSSWKTHGNFYYLDQTFFSLIVALCIRINLINLPRQLFIIKAWSFTRPCHSLKLKANSFRDYIKESFTTIIRQSLKLKTSSIRRLHCHL